MLAPGAPPGTKDVFDFGDDDWERVSVGGGSTGGGNPFFDKWTGSRTPWVNPRTSSPAIPGVPSIPGQTQGGGGPGSLTGWTQAGSGAWGTVPQVPSPGDTAAGAIGWNLENLPAIHDILNDIDPTIGTRRGIISDKLAGMVPEDVEYLLAQRAAERGIGGGSVNADYLKALGLTSIGQQREGSQEAGALANEVFGIQSPMFVTPGQAQEAQYLANLMASMPDPAAAGALAIALQRMGMRAGSGAGNVPGVPPSSGGGVKAAPTIPPRGTSPTAPTAPAGGGGWGFTPGPGFGGEEFDVPFDGTPTGGGASYPWVDPWASSVSGLPAPANMASDYVTERTGSQFDYGADDYGTGWSNFPGFEFMGDIAAMPTDFVTERTSSEFDWDQYQ